LQYTTLTKDLGIELNHIKKNSFDVDKCFEHPSYFAHHFLGITPYRYQHQILRRFAKGYIFQSDRIIITKSRQIGISICLACLAVWFAFTNQAKSGPYKNTKVGIISRSDDQAKKLMAEIQKLVWNSPQKIDSFVKKDRRSPLSKKEIHFNNGWVKCFAPTDACRGETFDLLILDEAAFVTDEIFADAMEPTVSAVSGKIILSSTPNGQKGFFFELFDPFDMRKTHEYKRFWYHWQMCENEAQKKIIKQKLKHSKNTGNLKSFEQEYNAKFTVDEEAFFEDQDVERGLDRELTSVYEWRATPCSVGIDYGFTKSATCVTVVSRMKRGIQVLFQYAHVNFDENLLMDENWEHSIPNLMKRYNVQFIVTDDCPMGARTNKQLENEGYPIVLFNFRSDQFVGERNRGYYLFRTALRKGEIKYPEFRKLMAEMKTLQETRMEGGKYFKVKAPRNYSDDRCDSMMIASFPFLSEQSNFSSIVVDYKEVIEKMQKKETEKILENPRYDPEWEKITNQLNPDF